MLIIFARAILLYVLIVFAMRLMGKRQIGELQPSELVITMMVSNMAILPIEDISIPMLVGAIPILTLVCFEIILSNFGLKSKKFRRILSGNPIVVIEKGEIVQKAMHKLRFSIDDLMEGLRGNDVFDLKDVEYAIVETNGKISVLKKFSAQNTTAQMLQISGNQASPPLVMVSDGKLMKENLGKYGITQDWIFSHLRKKGLRIEDIFVMTVDENKAIFAALKEKGSNL